MEIEFNYCDKNEWVQYIKEVIIPLKTRALNLMNFWNYLNNYIGIPVSEIIQDELLKVKLLGGVLENGEFKPRSLALLHKTLFGWSLNKLNEYLLHKSEDIEIEVFTIRNKPDFINFIETILDYCASVLTSAYEIDLIEHLDSSNSETEGKRLFNSDIELIEEINNLYEYITMFTINYNPKTLFIWTLRKNTKRNLAFQYKKLQDRDCFEKVKNIVGLYKYYALEIAETKDKKTADKIIDDYSVWELRNQFGYYIFCLNDYIFKSFEANSHVSMLFNQIIENPEDFQQKHENRIERLKPLWEIPEEHNIIKPDKGGHGRWSYKYSISGAFLIEFFRTPSQLSRYKANTGKCSKSLLDFLDGISPALFLNKINLIIRDNTIWYD